MTAPGAREREPDAGGTLRGVALILAAGIVLGAAWNALGLASRPPYGLTWIARPPAPLTAVTLPPTGRVPPADTVLAPTPRPASVAARPATGPRPRAATPPARAPAPAPPPAPPPPARDPPRSVELAAFKQLYDADGALIVDAREPSQYEDGHVAGAISLPYNGALAEPERVKGLDPGGRPFVVYCSGRTCELAMDLARFLVESGKQPVLVFEGGFSEWKAAGYPVALGPAAGSRP
jgi:rhodanese-related sulfurtransferase